MTFFFARLIPPFVLWIPSPLFMKYFQSPLLLLLAYTYSFTLQICIEHQLLKDCLEGYKHLSIF